MLIVTLTLGCVPDPKDTGAGSDSAADDTETGDTGNGGDTGDSDTDSDSDTDTDTDDSGLDTATHSDTGADSLDITGNFNGDPFVMNFDDAPADEIRCQSSLDYYFAVQDPAGKYQFTLNIAQPVEGETVSYPNLVDGGSVNTFSLGAVSTWALDTSGMHGSVQSAYITTDYVEDTVRVTGSFEVVWIPDGAKALPGAAASGTFDLGCY